MKKLLLLTLIIGSNLIYAQDTTFVQTFTYDSISTRRATFPFPADLEGKTFEKVLMYYNIKCDPLTPWDGYNCGEWDYLAYSHIYDHLGTYDSVAVEGPRYKVNGESPDVIPFVNEAYYNYHQNYEKFITYSAESDNDYMIGMDALTSNAPFGTNSANQRTQILWLNSELSDAGVSAGEIAKIRFDVTDLGEAMGHLTVKMKHSETSEITGFDDEEWIIVYDRNTSFAAVGSNTLNLTYPFDYDGASHILMDISFNNEEVLGDDNNVTASASGFNSVISTNEQLGYLNIEPGQWAQVELSDYDFEDQVTISFWSNGNADHLPVNTSVLEGVDSLNNRVFNIHFPWSNSRIYWDIGAGSGYDRIDKEATAAEYEDTWNHWAFTKDATAGTLSIYKNGTLWHSGTDLTRAAGIINRLILGTNKNFDTNWAGKLDEFRIWDVALDASTISDWMNKKLDPSHPNYSNLVVYYDFDNSPLILDRSGNNRDAMASATNMIQFYDGSNVGSTISTTRPNITFVQGTYESELDSILVIDSVMVKPISIMEFAVDGRKFEIVDVYHKFPTGTSKTFDHLGDEISSTEVTADGSYENETIVYYNEPYENIVQYEIGRFITPYGIGFDLGPNGFTYVYDVTDYQSLLKGDVDFQAHNTQELIDIKFVFVEGTPPRDVISLERLWDGKQSYLYKNLDDDVNLTATEVELDAAGEMFKVRSRITGHGHNGSNNCCEWGGGRDHELYIDGVLRDEWEIWQEVECGENPNISQGGTWPYAREGWCPGDIVEEHEFDITPFVTPGTTTTIDYDIEDVPAGDPDQGNGNYVIAMHMVTYGGANFDLDAAVVDVLNPNDWEYYKKWNPTCQNPRVIIKNTGATTLTSAQIDVWVGGFDNVITFDWTGELAFLEEEVVEIPITPEWWQDFEGKLTFSAQIRNPNWGVDEYSNNNVYTVNFEAAPVINEPFFIWFKTNNKASENKLYLRDENGDIVFSRETLENETEYRDTMNLPTGCYTLELTDSDHDGISFWYSAAAEGETAGYLRLRQVGGGMIKTFDPDFGAYTSYSFSVGYAVGIDEEEEVNYNLSVYPNPNQGEFTLTLDNFIGENIALEIYNELGANVYNENIGNMNEVGYLQKNMDLSSLSEGVYILRVISDKKSVTRRIVIQ
ncbi:T9SS type A sorting domain-containing protein [Crocinitomix algicola]|uniref:T9SS type A sorting domain-containing protein n=1 Tax=Crocinitomix algicola TaxID=1740263 RepID=UPI000871B546|nr:LamG-like jellyroll fold domain-containing protein [Crocinitomix algicola]